MRRVHIICWVHILGGIVTLVVLRLAQPQDFIKISIGPQQFLARHLDGINIEAITLGKPQYPKVAAPSRQVM